MRLMSQLRKQEVVKIENEKKGLLRKTWFGKVSALSLQMAADGRIFMHVRRKENKAWSWKKVKFSSTECVAILQVLDGKDDKMECIPYFQRRKQHWHKDMGLRDSLDERLLYSYIIK